MYFWAARLGLQLAFANESASAVWPPTGIAIAALLIWGRRLWPGVTAGALLANLVTTGNLLSSLGIAVGNTLEAVVAVELINRFAGGTKCFGHAGTALRYVAFACVGAPVIAATIGVGSLLAQGLAAPPELGWVWFTWWIGDLGGALLVGPAIVLWHERPRLAYSTARALEAAAVVGVMAVVGLLVFGATAPSPLDRYPLGFLFIPPVIWMAFRFGPRESSTAALLLAAIATLGTLAGRGPFGVGPPEESLILLQLFLAVLQTSALGVAAVVNDRDQTVRELRRSHEDLETRVRERTDSLTRALETLRETESEMKRVTGSISDYLWSAEVGPDGVLRHRFYSPVVEQITGYPANWYLAEPGRWILPIHPDDRPKIHAAAERVMRGDSQHEEEEYRIIRPDGTVRWIRDSVNVVREPDGLVRLNGVATDVTERRNTEEAIRRSREQLAESQRIAHVGSWEWDITADKITWSDELFRIFDIEPAGFDATYESYLRFLHPDDRNRVDSIVHESFVSHKPFEFDHRILRADGSVRHIHSRGRVVVDGQGRPVRMLGTAQDITERYRADEERELARQQIHELERLKRMNEFKTQFMNTAAHELGTPLTPIRLQLHVLKTQGDQISLEKRRQSLEVLERNLDRLNGLVQDLLLGAQLQADRLVLDLHRVDLLGVARDAVRSFEAHAREKNVHLHLEGDHAFVEADAKRLSQVVYNLLSNAVKFTPSGGRVEVVVEGNAREASLRVKDNGIGVRAPDIRKLFQPFSQLQEGTTKKSGTGLGLYISRGLVELHHGRMWCESEGMGKGATFAFAIPASQRQSVVTQALAAPSVASSPTKPY